MTFTPTLTLGDLPPGSARKVVVDGHEVALVHTEGTVFAVGDQCSHADVSLSEGEVDGCTLECWLHGSRFDLLTGDPSGPPATVPVAVHHVTIEGDDVYVALKEN